MRKMIKPLCALTMGDPSGIGPEVILKTLFSQRAKDAARMVVIGYPEPFERDARLLDKVFEIKQIDSPQDITDNENILHLITPGQYIEIPMNYGIIDKRCGKAATFSIEHSAKLAINRDIDAIVTAPINYVFSDGTRGTERTILRRWADE